MKLYQQPVGALTAYNDLLRALERGATPCAAIGLSSVHKANFAAALFEHSARTMLLLTPDELAARRLCEDVNEMLGRDAALLFPAREPLFRELETASGEYEQIRISVLLKLALGEPVLVVAAVDAVMQYTLPKAELLRRTATVRRGETYPQADLLRQLEQAGYTRRPQIDGKAQYAVRGGIVDLFPPHEPAPVRIEFWDDEVDSLSAFDLDSQRRTDSMQSVQISPAGEVLFDSVAQFKAQLSALCDRLSGKRAGEKALGCVRRDLEKLDAGVRLTATDKYRALAYDEAATLFDYLDGQTVVILSETNDCRERAQGAFDRLSEEIKLLLEEGELCDELCEQSLSVGALFSALNAFPLLSFETFTRSMRELNLRTLLRVEALQNSGWSGDLKSLCEDLQSSLERGYCCAVLAGTPRAAAALTEDLRNAGLPASHVGDLPALRGGQVYVLKGGVSAGFAYPEAKFTLITSAAQRGSHINRARRRKGEEIKSLSDLHVGDLVVHVSHGIGVFDGIHQLDLHGVKKDYMKIRYAGADTLFVPVTQLDLVSRYIGAQNEERVKLNKLNSGEWQKTRRRVKTAVAEMADEFIQLYAARMRTPGFAFSPDDVWQRQFEERFPYEETDDQLRCAQEIKADMERPHPMDRLLCADVGFGKTEVALRAAFKCVMDSKQCAILCPTTILAWQHYQTIVQRMEGFPITVRLLSRFRTPKEQRETVKGLKNGTVDIVIGTHRLVQKDVEFKALGLAIIDEEQRFGVRHKERFKELFHGVDMLSLSATPIPRTLNMAMSGIRDMSVIEEAPQDRYPVQSYVLEYDRGILVEAMVRELRRGGQVYYVHNRIESIELCAAKIREALPDARIGVAHGKMGEEQLSEIWRKLLEQEIDILVCTTLIETGVDVANCNTLIVEDADNMGLSQLYQLRGRVGRSNRRAYAYFTFRRGKALSEVAAKRLSAIREFTQFGSGFRIALRDLEIRGAGSLLGAQQHGQMEAVGYDMYMRLLSDAVREQRGEPPQNNEVECLIDLPIDAHIPESYIENLSQRLDVYRKIASVRTQEDCLDVTDELIDRFGEPPRAVQGLIDVALLRNTAQRFGLYEIKQQGSEILLKPTTLDMQMVGALTAAYGRRVTVHAGNKPSLSVAMTHREQSAIELIQKILQTLRAAAEAQTDEKGG